MAWRSVLIWFSKETLQTQKHARHVVHRTPLILQDVQADSSREIHIRMVDGRFEVDGRWGIGVVVWEVER